MARPLSLILLFVALCVLFAPARAQETPADGDEVVAEDEAATTAGDTVAPVAAAGEEAAADEPAAADVPAASDDGDAADTVDEFVDEVADDVDRDPNAQRAKAGILEPIYALAERFSFPWFHWLAFGLMVAGVVSFALQLVLGKLFVLARGSISFSEILSDGLGLVVSLIGLVLTTQAAAENSTFTTSAFQVLSATAAGALGGFIFYLWGQRQEIQAAAGRRAAAATRDVLPPRK